MAVKFSNNAKTTISGSLSTSATSVTVADASNFPTLGAGDYTYVTLAEVSNLANLEIVKVTAISSNTFTIVRAQHGTTARSFSTNDLCELRVTAGLMEEAIDEVTLTGIDDNATSTAITIDSSERVGIGTASPNFSLEVQGSSNQVVSIQTTGTTDNTQIRFGDADNSDQGKVNYDHSTDAMTLHTADTERFRIDSSGNVGIGTLSPVSPLEVKGSAPVVTANSSAFAGSGNGTGFGIYRSAAGRTAGYTWSIENVISSGGSSSSDYQTDNLVFKGRASTSASSLTERMRITQGGNVGIGTTSPDQLLDVGDHTATANRSIRISQRTATNSTTYGGLEFFYDNSAGTTGVNAAIKYAAGPLRNDGELTFHTGASGSISERLRIDHDGGVIFKGSLASHQTNAGVVEYSSNLTSIHSYGATAGTGAMRFLTGGGGGSGTSEAIRIDSSGNVGVNCTVPSAFYSGATNLVVGGGSGDEGITVYTGTTDIGRLHFADGTSGSDEYDGFVIYNHSNRSLQLGSAAATRLTLNSDGSATFASGINATSINTTATNVFAIAAGQPFYWKDTNATNGTQCNVYSYWYAQNTTLGYIGYGSSSNSHLFLSNASVGSIYLAATSANGFLANGSVMWHAGNDGSGSGLDADLWDGNQFSSYLNQAVLTTSSPTFATISYTNALYAYEGSNYVAQDPRWNSSGYNANEGCHHMYCTTASAGTYGQVGLALYSGSAYVYLTTKSGDSNFYHNNNKMWSAGNDGSGSGLDADTCDGQHLGTSANVTHNQIYANDWFRVNGADGIYWQDYGGGWYMSDTTWMRIYNSKKVYISNEIAASGNITAYYSDERLKTKTGSIENALEKVQSLEGFTYVENELAKSVGYGNDEQQVGVSAQQVQSVLPEAVSLAPFDYETNEETGEITSKSGEEYLTVDYSRLVPLLIEAIKEQQAQIEELKEAVKWQ